MKKVFLENSNAVDIFKKLNSSDLTIDLNPKKRKVFFKNKENQTVASLRFSLNLMFDFDKVEVGKNDFINYTLVMIRSGMASVGFFENGELLDHKVFRAYMVRKKQGKSQIKYLKTKGKSRAGSRVRLAETLDFFDSINSRLTRYFETYRVDHIVLSCSKTLLPYLFGGKVSSPFEKDDHRIFKLPKHVSSPTFESLLEMHKILNLTELEYNFEELFELEKMLNINTLGDSSSVEDEDW
ncbi:hypothetical protein A33Q_1246 [Indibacter alkaliphilus LW1]|uniref:VLRF1 domain-containing protein n=1 Tax=Indibacter alkaliphilus (strain CCUG 57479 / KCTC 22604 / LW1) TaxID=1189612 RepID=S2DHV7_INDAL|nr:hypothetical protein [Indibacter alkaliphilus]EOZ98592.1 hypothetical protein A33Q_1246 [Indibacter alkaliphilus LW1]